MGVGKKERVRKIKKCIQRKRKMHSEMRIMAFTNDSDDDIIGFTRRAEMHRDAVVERDYPQMEL